MSHSSLEPHPHGLRGLPFLMVTVVMWAVGPIFVKYFTAYYNVWTQNAFRYSCAAVILVAAMSVRGRRGYRLNRGQWGKLLLVTGANLLMQTNFCLVYYYMYPAVASLLGRVSIIFVTVLSFILFHDERRVIRSPYFLTGSALALAGVVFVLANRDPELLAHLEVSDRDFWIGAGLAVSFAFFVSVYALTIKHAVRDIPPLVSFTHVSWMTALGLTLLMLVAGGGADLWRQPVLPLGLMVVSALLSIVFAHSCYYAALRHIKAVVSTSLLQLTPLVTCVCSAIVYGDRLTPLQIAGGGAVIVGAWLAALAQAKAGGRDKPTTDAAAPP